MELQPRTLVVGLYLHPLSNPGIGSSPAGQAPITDRLSRIWREVRAQYGFTRFELSSGGMGAQIQSATEDDALIVQPPLVQVRVSLDRTGMTSKHAMNRVCELIKVVGTQLNASGFSNLVISHIYPALLPGHDGRVFVPHPLLARTEVDLGALQRRGGELAARAKFVVREAGATFIVLIEPVPCRGRQDSGLRIAITKMSSGPAPRVGEAGRPRIATTPPSDFDESLGTTPSLLPLPSISR